MEIFHYFACEEESNITESAIVILFQYYDEKVNLNKNEENRNGCDKN